LKPTHLVEPITFAPLIFRADTSSMSRSTAPPRALAASVVAERPEPAPHTRNPSFADKHERQISCEDSRHIELLAAPQPHRK
jgi:hypothetical protein